MDYYPRKIKEKLNRCIKRDEVIIIKGQAKRQNNSVNASERKGRRRIRDS
ncbi:MAG: hypothetical protein ACP5FU_06075 [Nitrososphaeria archaeon]